mmetsp:Transcript_4523/g.8561  ORF Transcript_4523/g.8561 Transcript_4523/m.8561 type:complete len:238 (+) Transcript_4523:49-762(+)
MCGQGRNETQAAVDCLMENPRSAIPLHTGPLCSTFLLPAVPRTHVVIEAPEIPTCLDPFSEKAGKVGRFRAPAAHVDADAPRGLLYQDLFPSNAAKVKRMFEAEVDSLLAGTRRPRASSSRRTVIPMACWTNVTDAALQLRLPPPTKARSSCSPDTKQTSACLKDVTDAALRIGLPANTLPPARSLCSKQTSRTSVCKTPLQSTRKIVSGSGSAEEAGNRARAKCRQRGSPPQQSEH